MRSKLLLCAAGLGAAFLLLSCVKSYPTGVSPVIEFQENYPEKARARTVESVTWGARALMSCRFFRVGWPNEYWRLHAQLHLGVTYMGEVRAAEEREEKVCGLGVIGAPRMWLHIGELNRYSSGCDWRRTPAHEFLHNAGFGHGAVMAGLLDSCLYQGAGDAAK